MTAISVDEQPRRSGRERKRVVSVYDEAATKKKTDEDEKEGGRRISSDSNGR